MHRLFRTVVVLLLAIIVLGAIEPTHCSAEDAPAKSNHADDVAWMTKAKFGVFMHYQYRILLGKSIATKPQFPDPADMTAEGWNKLVDGFDVKGFAEQMSQGHVGWVLFCIDDHYYAWPCSPNKAFDEYTGYKPGEKCSRRDLIAELADALAAKDIKLICYFAGLNGYMKEPQITKGLLDDGNNQTAPPAEGRARRLAILKEYADRFKDRVAGWWFDGVELNTYRDAPGDWSTVGEIVRTANPKAVIAFSYGSNEWACIHPGIDNYTAGDTWSKQDLAKLTPKNKPAQKDILWHGKIYCGNVYHGQGTSNMFAHEQLTDWIKTCNRDGGICTLDWPIEPQTGLLKDFGFEQLKHVGAAIRQEASK